MRGDIVTGKMAVKRWLGRIGIGLMGGAIVAVLAYFALSGLFALGPDLGPQEPFLAVATVGGAVLGFALGCCSADRKTAERRLLPSAAIEAVPLVLVSLG